MTVVVGKDGTLRAVPQAKSWALAGLERSRTYQGSRSLFHEALTLNMAYSNVYTSQPWIYAAVNKLSRGVARLPLKQYERLADDRRRRLDPAHDLRILIEQPWPRGSRFKLVEATVGNLCIYGNAAWWKYRPRAGQAPVELWPLDWRYMSFKSRRERARRPLRVPGPRRTAEVPPRRHRPLSVVVAVGPGGTSPLEPLRETLALETAGRRYAVSSFAHGARPSGALKLTKTLDKTAKEELREEIQALNAGPDNAFRIALLDGGMEWQAFSHNAQEAETIAHRKLNREEACAVYDIPPPVLHILDRATFSNVSEQNKALYRETMGPWTVMLEETVEAQLIRGELAWLGTYPEFDLNEVLKADLIQRAAAYKSMESTISVNERRAAENLPPIGDVDDDSNPANGVLLPLNMGVVLPNGTMLTLAGDEAPTGLLAALQDEIRRVAEALLEERELAAVD